MGKKKNRSATKNYILGLDLGTNSIGWALIDEVRGKPVGIRRAGVRRFEAGVQGDIESGRDEPPTADRRAARQQRRQHWRRAWRQAKLFRILQRSGLLPAEAGDSPDARHASIMKLDREIETKRLDRPDRTQAHLLPYLLRDVEPGDGARGA